MKKNDHQYHLTQHIISEFIGNNGNEVQKIMINKVAHTNHEAESENLKIFRIW